MAVRAPLFGRVFAIALPLMLQQLVFQIQALINQAFLGNLNPLYLSVVANCTFPFFATATLLWALGTGVTILVSQNRGAGRKEEALRSVEGSLLPLALLGVFLFAIWILWPSALLSLLGVRGTVLAEGIPFISVLSFLFLLIGLEAGAGGYLQGIGRTRPLFVSGAIKASLNVALDWLLIFGNLGFPRLGLVGAAVATVASTVIADAYLLAAILRPAADGWSLRLREITRPSVAVFRRVAALGVPASVESFLWFVGMLAILRMLNGIDALAAGMFSLVFLIEVVPAMMYDSVGRATTTLIGEQTGMGNRDGARRVGWACLRYVFVLSGGVAVVFLVFPKEILGLFTRDRAVVEATALYLSIAAFTLFPRSGNIVIGSGIRGLGDTPWMLLTQIFGTVFVIALAATLVIAARLGLVGIFIALGADEAIRFVMNGLRFGKGRPKALANFFPARLDETPARSA